MLALQIVAPNNVAIIYAYNAIAQHFNAMQLQVGNLSIVLTKIVVIARNRHHAMLCDNMLEMYAHIAPLHWLQLLVESIARQ